MNVDVHDVENASIGVRIHYFGSADEFTVVNIVVPDGSISLYFTDHKNVKRFLDVFEAQMKEETRAEQERLSEKRPE